MSNDLLKDLFRLQLNIVDGLIRLLPDPIKTGLENVVVGAVKSVNEATAGFLKAKKQVQSDSTVKKVDVE